MSEWQRDNRDKARAHSKTWRDRNPERNRERAKREHNKERARETTRMRKYGLTRDEVRGLLARDPVCGVCGAPYKTTRGQHIEHDHTTKVVRGVACSRCNTVLGLVGDDIGLLAALGRYLVSRRRGWSLK